VDSRASALGRIPFNTEIRSLPETPFELLPAALSASVNAGSHERLGLAANARRKWYRWRSRLGFSRRWLLGAVR
jgi:hypothetical protein